MKHLNLSLILLICLTFSAPLSISAQESYYLNEGGWIESVDGKLKENPAFEFVDRNPLLPDVLLIGNSISIGYTPSVRNSLKGVANVYRIPENGGDTYKFLENHKTWLSCMEWDIIHINVGLHDLKRMDEQGKLDAGFERRVSPDQYQVNLDKIFRILEEKTDASVIWATTTLVPEGSSGRITGDEKLYNERSLEVLKKHPGIHLNDLYKYSLGIKEYQREANVHYLPEGSEKLGEHVAKIIRDFL